MRQLFGLSRMLRAVGGYQWWVWPLARLALVGASLNSSLLTLAIDPTGSTGPLGRNISSPIACCSLGITNWKKWPICLDFSEAVGSLCQLLLEGQRITQLTHICRWLSVAVILEHPSQSHKFQADLVKLCQCSIRRAVILLKLLQKGDDCFELNPPIFFEFCLLNYEMLMMWSHLFMKSCFTWELLSFFLWECTGQWQWSQTHRNRWHAVNIHRMGHPAFHRCHIPPIYCFQSLLKCSL